MAMYRSVGGLDLENFSALGHENKAFRFLDISHVDNFVAREHVSR